MLKGDKSSNFNDFFSYENIVNVINQVCFIITGVVKKSYTKNYIFLVKNEENAKFYLVFSYLCVVD